MLVEQLSAILWYQVIFQCNQSVMADCIICKEPLENGVIVSLGEKSSASVNRASVECNDSTVSTVPGQ